VHVVLVDGDAAAVAGLSQPLIDLLGAVRVCAQRHFDQALFDDLTRQLDRPSRPTLRIVTRDDPLNWPDD
jgi:hypothetical protein